MERKKHAPPRCARPGTPSVCRGKGIAGVQLWPPMALPTAHRDEVLRLLGPEDLTRAARRLIRRGFVHLESRGPGWGEAKRDSLEIVAAAGAWDPIGRDLPELSPVGEFIAPPTGALCRDYQPLHIDFGLPILAEAPVDVARFTVLYFEMNQPGSRAVTRIVRLERLLAQRIWPAREVIVERLRRSTDSKGPVEGILGRIIEAVDQGTSLPSATVPGYLCGMEFSSHEEENAYLRSHGMDLTNVEDRVVLGPRELLVIDNLRTAHGRLGQRRESELHQLFLGYTSLARSPQRILLDRILVAFNPT